MNNPSGLFRKYAFILVSLVGGAVVTGGSLEMAFNYRETSAAIAAIQRSEVRAAAVRIEQFLATIQSHIEEVGALPWASGLLSASDRRDEYHRLMKLVPAIAEITHFDAHGKERLLASRMDVDRLESLRDGTSDAQYRQAKERGLALSPTYFKNGSEPYVSFALRDKSGGAVNVAELNLKFVGDVVRRIKVGDAGRVYVVDSADHLVAHPNLNLVLRKTDLSHYGPLQELRGKFRDDRAGVAGMIDGEGLEGGAVMISAALIPTIGWMVVVEQPSVEVMRPVYSTLARTAVVMVAGLLAALLVSYLLARRLSQPIVRMRAGAEKIANGDLDVRINVRTGDEIEALAQDFNHMAEQLQEYTTGLERKVAEKTAQLELANRHKSEFLANMSHELRTPLNAVIGFSDALREQLFGDLNAKQMEYVTDIHASGQHLLSLINDILDLSKIEAGRMELDVREFDIAQAIENCRTLIRERAQRRGLRLNVIVPPEIGTWVADERKLKQVVLNLLSNAVKFTPGGGEVRLSARRTPDALEIHVADTGPGIASDDQATIFEEFRQLHSSGEAKHEGTGLGLALSKRLVELHGGTIVVESAPGLGAKFVVRIPVRPGNIHD